MDFDKDDFGFENKEEAGFSEHLLVQLANKKMCKVKVDSEESEVLYEVPTLCGTI